MVWRWAVLGIAGTSFLAASAEASSNFCEGEMTAADCRSLRGFVWPDDSRPTVAVFCMSCSSNGDGGGSCIVEYPNVGAGATFALKLMVADRTYGPEFFEDTGTTCSTRRLYRYVGPLMRGREHTIVLPGSSQMLPGTSALVRVPFQVAGEPAAPPFDGAVDARADAATDSPAIGPGEPPPPPPPAARHGCSFSGGDSSAGAPLALLALCLLRRGRRSR